MKLPFSGRLKSKRLLVLAFAVVLAGLGFSTSQAACLSNDNSNDIMECGFTSAADFATKATANAPGDLDNVYSHYGLTPSEYSRFASSAKAGKVSTNGDVTVGGKVVATGAKSLGRNAKSASTPVSIDNVTYHESNIGNVTTRDNDVTVLFDDEDTVEFVVMNICGNPIKVTPNKPEEPEEPEEPAVEVTKTVGGVETKRVALNTNFTYTITVKNTGNVDLKEVTLTDTPDDSITLVSAEDGTITDNTWEYTLETLAVGKSETFKLTAKVTEYVSGNLKNTVCVATPTIPDEDPADCDDAFVTVPQPEKIEVCEIATGKIITINEADRDNTKHADKDSVKCKIEVCDLTTKNIVTISRERFEANRDRYTEDKTRCEKTTTPPTTLPSTGTGEIVAGMMGAGSLAGAGYYWRASRREIIRRILG